MRSARTPLWLALAGGAALVAALASFLRLYDFGALSLAIDAAAARSPSREARRQQCMGDAVRGAGAASVGHSVGSGGPRAAIVVLFDPTQGWSAWAGPLAEHNVQRYAERHGYAVVRAEIDPTRPAAWSKLHAVRRALDTFPLVFYLDADMLIMDPTVELEWFVHGTKEIVMTADENGPNSGAFLVRSTPWAKAFMDRWDRTRGLVHAKSLGFQYEQRALHSAMGTDPEVLQHVHLLPPCAFNSQLRFRALGQPPHTLQFAGGERDFIVHLAGYYGVYKERLFVLMLQRSRAWCDDYPPDLLARIPTRATRPIPWNGRAHPWWE